MPSDSSAAWTVPPEHRPKCPVSGDPCTSWTCLVDVCVAPDVFLQDVCSGCGHARTRHDGRNSSCGDCLPGDAGHRFRCDDPTPGVKQGAVRYG